MILLILFAFLAGFVTILSPCILPILPIVLSGSLSGGKSRPFGVVAGFVGSFTFFTLFLSAIVRSTGIPADFMRTVAIGLVFTFGIFLVVPQAQLLFEKLVSKLSALQPNTTNSQSGFWGGLLVGASLGLVWAPCVGPILASIITLSITSQVTASAVLITLAYSIGTAIPMLIITYSGRRLFEKIPWLLSHTTQIQQMFGVLMIFTAIGLFFNIDIRFQQYILEKFPNYGAGLTQFEDRPDIQSQLDSLTNTENNSSQTEKDDQLLLKPGITAPGFQGEQSWINSEPLTLETDLKGKVVLVDFWTYTCINCVRTFPYLREWYEKYHDSGFEIIGVHSPEFEFEKKFDNVLYASKQYELKYPIVQDNDFKIWSAYQNRYWPAHYLIDANGDIRYTHFGEGKYIETENAIRTLLNESLLTETESEAGLGRRRQTPEIYLGYERAQNYTSQNAIKLDTAVQYPEVGNLPNDAVALEGTWTVGAESITANEDGAKLKLNFLATQVYLVIHPAETKTGTTTPADNTSPTNNSTNAEITVKLDGEPIGKTIRITQPDKYDIISLDMEEYGRHAIEITFPNGVSAFAFTFGS